MRKLIPRIKAVVCYVGCQNHQCTNNPACPFVQKTGKTAPKTLKDWVVLSTVCADCEEPCDTECEPIQN